ncbi:MBL fold metallo-hydrolase [Litorivivens sp.]|uniref:MBL fold metallo-hydrolase n=1 Tax=Litorivivens sp. TaxID=2020868 RepID=UPI00356767D1
MQVHRVKTRLVNSYVVEYTDKLLVVDVAVDCERQVLGFIEQELKRPVSDVNLVCCTHDDPDHIGGVNELARLTGADVGIPHAAQVRWKKWLNDPAGPVVRFGTGIREAMRARSWQMYTNSERDRAALRQARYGGDYVDQEIGTHRLRHQQKLPEFGDWRLLHTPGHTWDSCCFYHPGQGILLSGDTLLGSQKLDRLVVPSIYSNPRQMKATLRQLQKLQIQAVYPGHGSPQFGEQLIENAR